MQETIQNEDFWLNIGVSPRKLDGLNDNWLATFKQRIEPCFTDKQILLKFFNVNEINVNEKDKIKEIFKTLKGKEFYGLFNYLKGKIDSLRDFFTKLKLKKEYIDNPLLGLIYLYINDREKITDSFFYFLYYKTRMLEIWSINPGISEDTISSFKNINIQNYTKKLKLGKNRSSRNFKSNSEVFFCFEKSKKEDVVTGYGESKSIRRRGIYFIKFDLTKNQIEIRSGNPKILDLFTLILKDLNYKIYVESIKTKSNIKDIISKIIKYQSKNAKIIQLVFNKLEKGVNCQCTFRESKHGAPLNQCMSTFIDNSFVDPKNIHNLRSFQLDLNGFTQTILIDRKDPNAISFIFTNRGLSEFRYKQITKILNEDFGIEIHAPYEREESKLSDIEIFKNIIGKVPSELSSKEKEVYVQIASKGLLHSNEDVCYVCVDNTSAHRFYNVNINNCPKCGANIKKLEPREYIVINRDALFEFIVKRLKKIYGKDRISIRLHKIGKTKYPFVYFKDTKTEFYLYLESVRRIGKILNKIEISMIPIVKIIIDKEIRENSYNLSSEIFAYNLIFDKDEDIKVEINTKVIKKFEDLLILKTKDANQKLIEIRDKKYVSNGDEFEDLCYPLLRACFYGIYKWGKDQKRKAVPDGLYGITSNITPKKGFSLIYDCKYSSNIYDLDMDEKRKARDYIKRTNQAPEIKAFSKNLSCFMVISNSLDLKQFKSFSDYIIRYRGWSGKIVLLNLQDLITLYEQFMINKKLDSPLRINLGLAFKDYMNKSKGRVIILDKQDVKKIINNAKRKSDTIDQVSILNHLKTNIEF
ncbi:hypothetical protein HYV49_04975 [Candidatus Pacearchaeota archaeon]|nr:hypothetical protein [Candidatus Pacearchaeota archaeon]